MRAIWNGEVIAESDETVVVEGNHYFPPESVNMTYLKKTFAQYTCPWKGVCDYYRVTVGGETIEDGAWMYPEPSRLARQIKGYFAFWHGVEIKQLPNRDQKT